MQATRFSDGHPSPCGPMRTSVSKRKERTMAYITIRVPKYRVTKTGRIIKIGTTIKRVRV